MANEGTTILLAEDDITLSDLYVDILKKEGFSVIHASNGEDALAQIREFHPNLVLLDIMMPKMNGLQVLQAVREDPATKSIPVIIITALAQDIENARKLLNPADSYIVKSEVLPADIIEQVKKRLAAQPEPDAAETAAEGPSKKSDN